jgi:hypothetical protein
VDDYVAGVRRALQERYDVDQLTMDGRPVLVGSRKDFRLRWLATQLVTTVTVAAFDGAADRALLDDYLASARREAQLGQGARTGLQSGSAAVVVAVLPELTATAREWATRAHGHGFAAVAYPVAVGVRDQQVVEPQRMRVGRLFQGFLHDVVQEVAAGPLRGLPAA